MPIILRTVPSTEGSSCSAQKSVKWTAVEPAELAVQRRLVVVRGRDHGVNVQHLTWPG